MNARLQADTQLRASKLHWVFAQLHDTLRKHLSPEFFHLLIDLFIASFWCSPYTAATNPRYLDRPTCLAALDLLLDCVLVSEKSTRQSCKFETPKGRAFCATYKPGRRVGAVP